MTASRVLTSATGPRTTDQLASGPRRESALAKVAEAVRASSAPSSSNPAIPHNAIVASNQVSGICLGQARVQSVRSRERRSRRRGVVRSPFSVAEGEPRGPVARPPGRRVAGRTHRLAGAAVLEQDRGADNKRLDGPWVQVGGQ